MRAAVAAALVVAFAVAPIARADDMQDLVAQAAIDEGASPGVLTCMAWRESRDNPRAVGSLGEIGLFQLYPRGSMWARFFAWGFDDPWSPDQQAHFAARAIAAGYGPAWSTWWGCA